jgi:capsular polysaccharide biosynthesis protein
VNDPDRTIMFSSIREDDDPDKVAWPSHEPAEETGWPDDEPRDDEPGATDDDLAFGRSVTFTSLGFIKDALKRSAWLWCTTAVLGILIGFAFYAKFPPAYQATTSVLVTDNPNQNPADEVLTDVALAQSQTVAGQALRQLGLDESVTSFLGSYTVTDPSNQVLVFTVNAKSSPAAVRQASALVTQFLQFRAGYLTHQLQVEQATLNQQVTQARQTVSQLNTEIAQVSDEAVTTTQQAKLASLRAQLTTAENNLNSAQQNATATLATDRTTTTAMVKGSQILSAPTAVPHSFKKGLGFYIFVTFLLGLVLGLAIVIVRALVSDRLRRRDEIAETIGAPVRLSIGPVGRRRKLPSLPSLPVLAKLPVLRNRPTGRRVLDRRRLVTHLGSLVPDSKAASKLNGRRLPSLAVVAVDNAAEVAPAVVQLASWNSGKGKQVVVADLSDSQHAARLLGVTTPGVSAVSVRGVDLTVVVPLRDEIALSGPLAGGRAGTADVDPELAKACASADLLLTLATLDPASGGDHLGTWAASAAAVVTTGRSSSTRIRAVGEMIRTAGLRLTSVVVIGADKSDESLGLVHARDDQSSSALSL